MNQSPFLHNNILSHNESTWKMQMFLTSSKQEYTQNEAFLQLLGFFLVLRKNFIFTIPQSMTKIQANIVEMHIAIDTKNDTIIRLKIT